MAVIKGGYVVTQDGTRPLTKDEVAVYAAAMERAKETA